jgi:hypothetical protein
MSAVPAVEQWLSAVAPRVRALRAAHGASRLVAAALGAASLVLLLDAGFALPAWARGLFLSFWVTAVGVLAWRWVLIPLRGELPLADVAQEVAKRWPELGARLLDAVAAPRHSGEAAHLLSGVDRAEAVPVAPAVGFVSGAALALAAVVATAALVPGSVERLKRVATPWARAASGAYRVVVTSGEPVVRRGGPVTLSAYAERAARAAGPPDAALVTRDGPDAPEARAPMTADGLTFHHTRPAVAADFDYCVEVGGVRSGWFRVSALDPVELAPATAVEVRPPGYAAGGLRRAPGAFGDVEVLQFGTVTFNLAFTQPAAAGHLDWKPDGDPKGEPIGLDFAPDRLGATARLQPRASGTLRLVLVREAGGKRLRTDVVADVRVRPDSPPRLDELTGLAARPRIVTPAARIPIALAARDDLGVSGAELQYVVGPDDANVVSVPLALSGAGAPRAAAAFEFDLSGKARVGDVVRVRVVVTDGRAAGADAGPQAAAFPRTGWSELRVAAAAPPLAEQDIACARDALGDALAGAQKDLKDTADEAAAVQTAAAGSGELPFDLASRLGNARDKVRAARAELQGAADDAALNPAARPLAAAVGAVVPVVLAAEDALRRAETDSPAARAEALAASGEHLRAALAALAELAGRNRRESRAALDRLKLTALAADQAALAKTPPGPAFAAAQAELRARFAALLAESEPLRAAHDSAKADELRRFAAEVAQLAARLRELDAAARQTDADARAALVAAVARALDANARRAASVFARLGTPARLAGAPMPTADELARVGKLAAAGNLLDALAASEKHAQQLARLADAFDRLAAERADPKFAARQFAQWQADLLDRVRAAGAFAALPDATKSALRAEQTALAAAVEGLTFPPDEAVKAARDDAVRHTALAVQFLGRGGAGAEDAMKAAGRALAVLSERAPAVGERHTKARAELDKLRADFEASNGEIDRALRTFERQPEALAKRLAPHADKQRKTAAAVAALDLPGLGDRQQRVAAAFDAAVADLRDSVQHDVSASQLWVRRELERLKLALEGAAPPDAKADEAFRKLTAAADALDADGPGAAVTAAVGDAGRQLAQVASPDAQVLLHEARVAVQATEAALRDAKPDAACRVRSAAAAVGRLCDRLNGLESEAARVRRLAALRRAAAANPKELLTSDEAVRQLSREWEEFTRTRVGPDGQALKKKALDLYAKLRAKSDPDRVGTDLKALAAALDDLAPKVPEATFAPAARAPDPADEYLPSRARAEALRDLERRQRAIQAQIGRLPDDFAAKLKPVAGDPLAAIERAQSAIARDARQFASEVGSDAATRAAAAAQLAADAVRVGLARGARAEADNAANFFRQLATEGAGKPWAKRAADLVARQDAARAELAARLDNPAVAVARQAERAAELGRAATELAARLARGADTFDATDSAHAALVTAAAALRDAETRLADATRRRADGSTEADKLRAAALETLRAASEAFGAPVAGAVVAPGEALRDADRAMRKDTPAAARQAADALERVKRG